MSEHDMVSLRAFVHGRVQGVGFRFFVEERASRLGLRGFVRNLSNGRSVEVVVEGGRHDVESLLTELRRGPSMAYVERVEESWGEASGGYGGFAVR